MIRAVRFARSSAPVRALRSAAGALLFLSVSASAEAPDVLSAPATNLLAAVSSRCAAVTNLACTVRRQLADGGGELVSRVVWARGGRLNVETLSPAPRRVVVDGEWAWTKSPADKAPGRVAFDDQSPAQKANALCIPASPEETLAALDPATGVDRPVPDAPWLRQTVFRFLGAPADAADRAVVSLDEAGRVRAVDLFSDAACRWRVASYAWDAPVRVLPDVWLFSRATAETVMGGKPVAISTRFDDLRANQPLDPDLFDADKAFR